MRRVDAVVFVQMVPVIGTGNRFDAFESPQWTVHVDGNDVVLERVAGQNIAALPAFRVKGVGFSVVEEKRVAEQARVQRDGDGCDGAEQVRPVGNDGGAGKGAAAGPKQAQGRAAKAPKVKP